ncbi:MAG: hypothetical protein S4CHLAM45_04930 [Chlamydiales bacterium]|nr:hypothetical protein [Chlamydiales bacterium]MCH9619966.1 hypothetical protein [Chlamydiales bacterium]MCH9622607.1 hypothetical protein [Chlamydiales bacterium]
MIFFRWSLLFLCIGILAVGCDGGWLTKQSIEVNADTGEIIED